MTRLDPGARRRLLRWGSWFAFLNAALFGLVGLRYLWYYASVASPLSWLYAIAAYMGHLGALAFIPFLLLVPVIVLLPRPRVILPLGVLLASAGLVLLLLDSLVFADNRYHLNVLTLSLLAPLTWLFVTLYFLVGLVIEAMAAVWLWNRTVYPSTWRGGWYLALGLGCCLLAAHLVHAFAEARYYVPVTAFTRYLPLYYPLRAEGKLIRLGLVDRDRAREQGLVTALGRPPDGALKYPLAPLSCAPSSPVLNVVLVVIDAMRADALTPVVAPRLTGFAAGATRFDAHYSGGNSSRAGMFSLFYGLPATYWDAFADVAQPPVLMDLFRKYDYQFGVFASSPIFRQAVALDRTALARIPNLRTHTGSQRPGSSGRDWTLTEEWIQWLKRRDPARPFFGFLYYNAVVAIEPPDNYPAPVPVPPGASAEVRKAARYLAAVRYVDALVGRVVDDLERRRLLDRTVVIVTSDHGMEFDENGLGFTGHGTAYSELQMHTPLLVRWPGRAAGVVTRRTSHFDVAPTLLTGVFGCTNPPADYASGRDLFVDGQWDWLLAASYTEFALLEPDRVTVIFSSGYEIRDRGYRLLANPTLSQEALRAAHQEMSRFYR